MLTIRITPGSPAPLYTQIVTQVRTAIASGAIQTGELLPSVRSLADQLLINANTVAKAYNELSRDGLIETLPGRGLAIAPRRPGLGLTKAERLRRIDPPLTQLLHEAIALELSPDDLHDLLAKKWKSLAPEMPAT
ncbi:MAG TPA: GntR family transcriptional regulator [Phycisphaerae bacterium]|nr:GntR family transcriptional regulator [Phycisphaerae bacterium]